jgi:hypothetical protein
MTVPPDSSAFAEMDRFLHCWEFSSFIGLGLYFLWPPAPDYRANVHGLVHQGLLL